MFRWDLVAEWSGEWRIAPLAASLALALVSGVGGAQVASAQESVASERSDPSVLLEADTFINDEKARTVTADGNVEAKYGARALRADQVIYDLEKRTIRARGNVVITEDDGSVRYADEIEVDEELNAGVAARFAARIPGGGTAVAGAAVRDGEGRNALDHVVYTACPICHAANGTATEPTWTLRARRATQDENSRMISYRDAVLRFGDVPVLYLPYFAHPDPSSGSRSGLLPPDVGVNDRMGGYYQQPIYWSIGPDQDIVFAPRLHQKVNPLLGVRYRKRFYSGDVNIDVSGAYDQDFDGDGEKFGDETLRSHVFANGLFRVSDFWQWGFSAERASDDYYIRRYKIDSIDKRGLFVGDNLRLISQAYVEGQDPNTYASLSFVSFQGQREGDRREDIPLILPVGEIERVIAEPLLDGQLRLQASTAHVQRSSQLTDSGRVSAGADWRRDTLLGPGVIVSPFMMARGDYYRIANAPVTGDSNLTRAVGAAGFEARWPFLRTGARANVIVEPVAMVAYGSNGGNDERIANEDSLSFEFDETSLFRPNAAPNFDLWEPGARASFGLRTTIQGSGNRSASLLIGRRWRREAEPRFSKITNLDGEASDFVGAATADLGSHFGGDVRFRISDEDFTLARLDASIRASVWRVSVDGRYFQIDDSLRPSAPNREIRAGMSVRVTNRWSASYTLQRDLASSRNLNQNFHLIYRDDCTFVDLGYVRTDTIAGALGPNEGFQVRIGLTTLGVFGGG